MIPENFGEDLLTNEQALATELIMCLSGHTDGGRIALFNGHINQALETLSAERPLISTGFERRVGEWSSAIRRESGKMLYHDNHFMVLLLDDLTVDVISKKRHIQMCEKFGFKLDFNETIYGGDTFENEILYKSQQYDSNGNLQYGNNLRTGSFSFEGMTYEDPFVISESAANKMGYRTIHEMTISFNTNDIPLDLNGNWIPCDDGSGDEIREYMPLPKIGEYVKHGHIGRRRIAYNSIKSYTDENLRSFTPSDSVFDISGTITDVTIFSNDSRLEKGLLDLNNPAFDQFNEILEAQYDKYEAINKTLKKLNRKYKLSHDASYWLTRSECFLDQNWFKERSMFDFIEVKLTIVDEKPLAKGSKITNRSGGKGVVGLILPDKDMPVTENGDPMDICINTLGIVNRMIAGSMYEHEINFITEEYLRNVLKKYDLLLEDRSFNEEPDDANIISAAEDILELIADISPEQSDRLGNLFEDSDNVTVDDIYTYLKESHMNGVSIEIPPIMSGHNLRWLEDMYVKYEVSPNYVYFHPDDKEPMIQPIVTGKTYYFTLRHQPEGKLSARSGGSDNRLGKPSKSAKHKSMNVRSYANTPIKMGEQERYYLALLDNPNLVQEFANNEMDTRKSAIVQTITTGEFGSHDHYKVDSGDILAANLKVLGLQIENTKRVKCGTLDKF